MLIIKSGEVGMKIGYIVLNSTCQHVLVINQ